MSSILDLTTRDLRGHTDINPMAATDTTDGSAGESVETGGRHARYVLGILVVVYIFNFIDRQILSVLAEEIKADLGISDAQIGFLYGTAFAIFYALFGIPLARLADVWTRTRLIAIGLAFWSIMTALSGTARNFAMLAAFRFGVGIGEASASPAANSLLADYFSPHVRATVISIYCSGICIGSGLGIFLGGAILDGWTALFPDPAMAPLGLKGWQVAFLAVGLPGVPLAVLVARLREPKRGQSEGLAVPNHPSPFRETAKEFVSIVPPFTLLGLYQAGARTREFVINLGAATGLALVATALTLSVGEPVQWVALSVGIYGAFSWAQALARRDAAAFHLTFGSRAFVFTTVGFASISFVTNGVGFWVVPYLIRAYDVSATEVGALIGLGVSVGGWLGMTFGGVLADRLQMRVKGAPHIVGMVAIVLSLPVVILFLTTDSLWFAYILSFVFGTISPMWAGPGNTAIIGLVLPRMRAVAIALHFFTNTFLAFALGPFIVGYVSDARIAGGANAAEGLRVGMMASLLMLFVAFIMLWLARAALDGGMGSKLERARAAGAIA